MMTKEEVLEIVAYCKDRKMPYKTRLDELGASQWSFYEAKRRYRLQERKSDTPKGEFLQLNSTGGFVPSSITELEGDKARATEEKGDLKIECQTARGGMLRIQGRIPSSMLAVLVQNL